MKTVIIGGGIAGLSLAYHLLKKKNQHVVLIEAGSAGCKTSSRAAGMITPASEVHLGEEAWLGVMARACRAYPDFIADLSGGDPSLCDFHSNGTLLSAIDQDGVRELKQLAEFQTVLGLGVKLLEDAEIRLLAPLLSPRVVMALHATHEAHLDPVKLIEVLRRRLGETGCVIYENTTVAGLTSDGGRVKGLSVCETRKKNLFTQTGKNLRLGLDTLDISADAVVLATGIGHDILGLEGLKLPLRPVKGQALCLAGKPGELPLPIRVMQRYPIYLVPREDGSIVIGATSEELSDEDVTAGGMLDLLYGAWQVLPLLYERRVIRTWAGLRPATPDHKPILGLGPLENLYLFLGLYRHGILTAPYIGRELACLIAGEATETPWREFALSRFEK